MSLTLDEVKFLLAHAMAYDNRKTPGDANLASWLEASRRANWTLPAALDALHEHYARSPEFLMPGHITELIRADRRHPAPLRDPGTGQLPPGFEPRALPAAVDDSPAARRAITDQLLPWRRARRRRLDPDTRAAVMAELDHIRPAGQPTGGEPLDVQELDAS